MSDIWLRPDEAAYLLGTTPNNTRVLAHRRNWRRKGTGPNTRYHYDDVHATLEQRANLTKSPKCNSI